MTRSLVSRTWTEIYMTENGEHGSGEAAHSGPLKSYQASPALVLLGAPGAGKTTCLYQEEAEERGHYVTARDFITLEGCGRSKKQGTPLLIDGLDEIRAGTHDGRVPLDAIRSKLEKLNFPAFRLSCREAVWLGTNDWNALRCGGVYPDLRVVRLDPLSPKDIREILSTVGISAPESLVEQAENTGFGPLLENPQRLKMLARVVAEDGWPESRIEIFERTCRGLLAEENPEYQVAERGSAHTVDILLNRAGEMCALQLLSGTAGWTLESEQSDENFPALKNLGVEDIEGYQRILNTKLFDPFEGTKNMARFAIHRQVAEYLGARFLKGRLEEGLPLKRVLALMAGGDGMVVAPLQGLAAWLAALYPGARGELVERNPLGTILDGDPYVFSKSEKIDLLRRLRKKADQDPWFWKGKDLTSRVGGLFSEDLVGEVQEALKVAPNDSAGQGFALFLVKALHRGRKLSPELVTVLIGGLREDKWTPALRRSALVTLIEHIRGEQDRERLIGLLRDFGSGKASDQDDDLAGRLLKELYPEVIGVPEVLEHLHPRRDRSFFGSYYSFWMRHLFEPPVSGAQRCELLNAFVEKHEKSPQEFHDFERVVYLALLGNHLEASRDDTALEKIFTWLETAEWGRENFRGAGDGELRGIHRWLRPRVDLRKSLLELGLERYGGTGSLEVLKDVEGFLLGNHKPVDFGSWCLRQIEKTDSLSAARHFAKWVAWSIHYRTGDQGLPEKDSVEARLQSVPGALDAFRNHLSRLSQNQAREDGEALERNRRRDEKRADRRRELEKHKDQLRENRAPPELLHNLAVAYFGGYADIVGDTPRDHLLDLVDGDRELVGAILEGLRGCVVRDDLPDPDEVINLSYQNSSHYLIWPFMAGMEEWAHESHEVKFLPNTDRMLLAFTIHYADIVPHFARGKLPPHPPSWYEGALRQYPECAGKSLIKVARIRMRARRSMWMTFRMLAEHEAHREIAKDVLPILLKSFPARCSQDQLNDLDILWRGTYMHCGKRVLLSLVERKMALASMNVTQRIFWLGMGLRLDPRLYLERVKNYVGDDERRVSYLLRVFHPERPKLSTSERWNVEALFFLIRLGGGICRPWAAVSHRHDSFWASPEAFESDLVVTWINYLSLLPLNEAAEAFERLKGDERLQSWRPTIQDAARRQRLLLEGYRFRHAALSAVVATLQGREPANPADLKALVVDQIDCLAHRIRDGHTNDWKQYWEIDKGRPVRPHHEDLCRNALLSDLQEGLRQRGVTSEAEGAHAGRKRSDIVFVHPKAGRIPVEVKRSNSRDLWSAIRNQLIPHYTREPDSDGHGIYLVFWFGHEHCRVAPDGKRLESADELRQMLENGLLEDEGWKISVCVIDVAISGKKEVEALNSLRVPA